MPKPIGLAAAIFLAVCAGSPAAAIAGSGDMPLADALFAVARSNKPLLARTSAVDALGKLGTKDVDTVLTIRKGLQQLLGKPPVREEEQSIFQLHVVQALGNLGYLAREAVPDLVQAKGTEAVLNKAIDDAIQSVLTPAPAPPTPALPPIPPAPKPKTVADLQTDLTATDIKVRLAAAVTLGALGTDAAPALKDLQAKMTKDADASECIVNAQSAKQIADATKTLPADYIASLTGMLDHKDASVRVLAARNLNAAGKAAAAALPKLQGLATTDSDADVKCVANNAAQSIGKAAKAP